jgi:hypothetical protein
MKEIQVKELDKLTKKNKNFAQLLTQVKKNPRCRQLPLDSFLFLPIQSMRLAGYEIEIS